MFVINMQSNLAYVSMLELKLIHVNKMGPGVKLGHSYIYVVDDISE